MRHDVPIFFKSDSGRYGVVFMSRMFSKMLHECIRAGANETGGIFWGKYNDSLDSAIITGFSRAPEDSVIGRSSFVRGVAGLQRKLQSLWNKSNRAYYLGEWHFHPSGSSAASSTDIQQMFENANSRQLQCPEPIMIIIGGNPCRDWEVNINVYVRDGNSYKLVPQDESWQDKIAVI